MGATLLGLMVPFAPAAAQDASAEARVRKLEAEVRALQRRVFPGGDGRFFEPQIDNSAPVNTVSQQPATSTTAVTDILARLDAMEDSLQRLTGQVEQNSNAVARLTTRLTALDGGDTSRVGAANAAGTTPSPENLAPEQSGEGGAAARSQAVEIATPKPPAAPGPSAARIAAVQAITKPQTDDAADDEYSYGFRLWEAKFYPEAQQQLALFVDKYPNHWRATYGRNLLGRAYLDAGNARDAAPWFLRNYQADRNAARAADSLLYLAEAMIALKDTDRACIALAEFGETYPALAAGRLQDQYEANRRKVKCN
ncbi:MAG: tetratricopeptide repeat protein [Sphingomonadaceae bacterium]|nr:MAG: tetratricopeptide repeat protein [Sphingomonadaceae bacterium]